MTLNSVVVCMCYLDTRTGTADQTTVESRARVYDSAPEVIGDEKGKRI